MRTQQEGGLCKPGRGLSPALNHAGTLMLSFQLLELWKSFNCQSHPVYVAGWESLIWNTWDRKCFRFQILEYLHCIYQLGFPNPKSEMLQNPELSECQHDTQMEHFRFSDYKCSTIWIALEFGPSSTKWTLLLEYVSKGNLGFLWVMALWETRENSQNHIKLLLGYLFIYLY